MLGFCRSFRELARALLNPNFMDCTDSRFQNRRHAGRVLAQKLVDLTRQRRDVLVLGLPRGGVPVAFEIAQALQVPLDVFLVRKLGMPGDEELAVGAIAAGGVLILDRDLAKALGANQAELDQVILKEARELGRREQLYRGGKLPLPVTGKVVILVDDGLATGATMRAAVTALRRQNPARIVIAVPVAAPSACEELAEVVDEIVCAVAPMQFYAVGLWYKDFAQTTDDEVRELLELAERTRNQQATQRTHSHSTTP